MPVRGRGLGCLRTIPAMVSSRKGPSPACTAWEHLRQSGHLLCLLIVGIGLVRSKYCILILALFTQVRLHHQLPPRGLSNSILRLPTSRLKFTHRCPDSVLFSPDGPYWDTFRPVLTPDLPGLAPFWPHMTCGAQPPPHTRGEIFPFPSGRCCGLCCVVPARVPASVA